MSHLGLTCSDENARTKAHFAQEAGRVGLAVVFPDTSPRGVNIEGMHKALDRLVGKIQWYSHETTFWFDLIQCT